MVVALVLNSYAISLLRLRIIVPTLTRVGILLVGTCEGGFVCNTVCVGEVVGDGVGDGIGDISVGDSGISVGGSIDDRDAQFSSVSHGSFLIGPIVKVEILFLVVSSSLVFGVKRFAPVTALFIL